MIAARRGKSYRDRTRRTSQGRKLKKTWLIVCEGRETERNYLDGLKREDSVSKLFTIKVVRGKGGSRSQIVNRAIKKKRNQQYTPDRVICVLDTESLHNVQTRDDLEAARSTADENGVSLYLSNPAFEVWLLAHFLRTSQQFRDCDAVIVELNKRWTAKFGQPYDKSDRDVYGRLASRTQAAIENARAVAEHNHGDKSDIADCNSSTEVYRLVEDLISGETD
jgi:hypothetical protein